MIEKQMQSNENKVETHSHQLVVLRLFTRCGFSDGPIGPSHGTYWLPNGSKIVLGGVDGQVIRQQAFVRPATKGGALASHAKRIGLSLFELGLCSTCFENTQVGHNEDGDTEDWAQDANDEGQLMMIENLQARDYVECSLYKTQT
nr:hypothetical protein [Tanacetum cinerariifolium]